MNEAQIERCRKARERAAEFIHRVDGGARFFDTIEGDDITDSLLDTARFVLDTTDRMIAENESPH